MNRIVYVLNGPNLNLLGKRQPHIYGHETLAAVEADCRKVAGELGLDLRFHQSNREYEIIDLFVDTVDLFKNVLCFGRREIASILALEKSDT